MKIFNILVHLWSAIQVKTMHSQLFKQLNCFTVQLNYKWDYSKCSCFCGLFPLLPLTFFTHYTLLVPFTS